MKKLMSGHYQSAEGFDVYLVKKHECSDKTRKSGKTFADYRTVRYWNVRLHNSNRILQGMGTKAQAVEAARQLLELKKQIVF